MRKCMIISIQNISSQKLADTMSSVMLCLFDAVFSYETKSNLFLYFAFKRLQTSNCFVCSLVFNASYILNVFCLNLFMILIVTTTSIHMTTCFVHKAYLNPFEAFAPNQSTLSSSPCLIVH